MTERNKEKINELMTRGVENIYPTPKTLEDILISGKKLKIYHGMDATGPQLHFGHLSNLMMLEKYRQLGHEVIILFGDFTATIGDPTDKMAARVKLTDDQVNENLKTWKHQVSKVVDLDDTENPARILRNSEWLSKLGFKEIAEIASNLTAQNILERDMFQKRFKENKPIYFHELLYPLMQGYDSVAMDVDMEIGGTDQTFNMLVGRELQKKLNNKEKFVVTTTLLINPNTGKRLMSKSEGYAVGLNDDPNEMFGKIMSLPDEVIIQLFTDCTNVPMDEVKVMKRDMLIGKLNPRDAKARLAKEIVILLNSKEEAENAEKAFTDTFSKGKIPTDIQEVKLENGQSAMQALVAKSIVSSGSEWRRLVENGAVKTAEGNKIDDINFTPTKETVLRIGKKTFIKIVL